MGTIPVSENVLANHAIPSKLKVVGQVAMTWFFSTSLMV
jgi:hypothetical protein